MNRVALAMMLSCLAPLSAHADGMTKRLDANLLFGMGVVGPSQYDQGEAKLMATLNLTGFYRVHPSVSVGGVGLAVRATNAPMTWFFESDNFNEFGLAVPVATVHAGRKVAQVGVEI